jgi:AcrR family transcriptional regulator
MNKPFSSGLFYLLYGVQKPLLRPRSASDVRVCAVTRFSDEDRERIRKELIEAGHDLFAKYGFDRTRVSDVTEAVGIGTSTFYQFFDAKESLYLAVLVGERKRLFETLESEVATAETAPEEAETILRTMLDQVRSNPLIRRLFVDGEIRRIDEHLNGTSYDGPAGGACIDDDHADGSDALTESGRVLPQPAEWVARDDFRLDDPDVVRGVLRSLLFVTQAQNTPIIPEETYEEVEEALVDTVIAGLFAQGEEATD